MPKRKRTVIHAPLRRPGAKRRKISNGGMPRAAGFRAITQNVGRTPKMAFGSGPSPQFICDSLDAFKPTHAPLPRAVGGYAVVRTTQNLTMSNTLSLFGPVAMCEQVSSAPPGSVSSWRWTNICALSSTNGGGAVNAVNNTSFSSIEAMRTPAWQNARITPASFSIQIMNPNALQSTEGIIYIGRAKQRLALGGRTQTWEAVANELLSYSNPRLCSAGKLALRGVQVDAVPYDMNSMADFRTIYTSSGRTDYTWDDNGVAFDGLAPIFLFNPAGNELPLQVLVCIEWRVRFDPSNPAYATHKYYPPSSESFWARMQTFAESLGNGVVDIAEKIQPYAQLMLKSHQRQQLAIT